MRLLAPIIGLALLSACGQAGDLYLPDPKTAPPSTKPEGVEPLVPESKERKPGRPQEP